MSGQVITTEYTGFLYKTTFGRGTKEETVTHNKGT